MSVATPVFALENVQYEKKAVIAYVRVNRPKGLNALNRATIAELKAVPRDSHYSSDGGNWPGAGSERRAYVRHRFRRFGVYLES
jgi:hypothetical protein